jgi:hypothetical protein
MGKKEVDMPVRLSLQTLRVLEAFLDNPSMLPSVQFGTLNL